MSSAAETQRWTDEEAFKTICSGIEDAVEGVHIDAEQRRRIADDSFTVPVAFGASIADPLPILD